jgi:hypothetical protein
VGVPDEKNADTDRSPHPPRSAERVDLPRKRERLRSSRKSGGAKCSSLRN